ncbi:hypothetical protein RHGRI_026911 [Rhododendron griersonianum]|uniref:Protein FLX-like 3 n=1 Tax=Rhododendron griersonianum TaxID=479676 RepID=A0AAV6IVT3_9ERIC|nr:hypothetical protein RHGRI_026911 [Rhododendron griersonianum]
MAGRQRLPRHREEFHGFREAPRPALHRGPGPFPIHPAALEEELEIQHRDMQKILSENRHVMDENMILQRELAAAKDEFRRLDQVIPKLRADREAQVRELIDRGLKLEAELRDVEPLRMEVMQRAFEYEKKSNEEQVVQKQAMEKNLVSMAREIEKLRTEHLSVDRRSRGLGAGGYGMSNGSPEMRYAGGAYGDMYGGGAWGPYDKHGPARR